MRRAEDHPDGETTTLTREFFHDAKFTQERDGRYGIGHTGNGHLKGAGVKFILARYVYCARDYW